VPEHTTHYTLQAVGYDGTVAIRSFTLPVQEAPPSLPELLNYAWVAAVSDIRRS